MKYFRSAKIIANLFIRKGRSQCLYLPKTKGWRASFEDIQKHGHPANSPRLAKVHVNFGEACRMNSSNTQQLKAQSGGRGDDEVGVLSASRLECSSSTKAWLSDPHKATAQLNQANIYLPLTVDKAIICCGECSLTHTRTHTHTRECMSPVISKLSGWSKEEMQTFVNKSDTRRTVINRTGGRTRYNGSKQEEEMN